MRASEALDIATFVVKYASYFDNYELPQIMQYLKVHARFGTLIVVRDRSTIVAVVRWNWLDYETVNVLDLIIHPEWRSSKMIRHILLKAKLAHPQMKYMLYKREKYANREKGYEIARFLKMEKEHV